MLQILGSHRCLCDGLTRRDFLRVGALGGLGLATNATATPSVSVPSFGQAKSIILLFLYGGASQLETFDPKPDAQSRSVAGLARSRLAHAATGSPGST